MEDGAIDDCQCAGSQYRAGCAAHADATFPVVFTLVFNRRAIHVVPYIMLAMVSTFTSSDEFCCPTAIPLPMATAICEGAHNRSPDLISDLLIVVRPVHTR